MNECDLYVQMGLDLEMGWAPMLLQNARNAKVLRGSAGFLDTSQAIAPLDVPTQAVDRSMGDVHPFGNPHYLADPLNGLAVAARALGIHPERWLIATSLALGLAAGLAIRTAGMLYTFGCLVLPGLIAKNLCHEVRGMFIVAPVIALVAAVSGFVIAHHADYPPGQMTVAILCLFLILAWLYRSTVSSLSA